LIEKRRSEGTLSLKGNVIAKGDRGEQEREKEGPPPSICFFRGQTVA